MRITLNSPQVDSPISKVLHGTVVISAETAEICPRRRTAASHVFVYLRLVSGETFE